jgi:glutamate-1-semialdehyde 2,1-aminomutase
VAQQFVASSKLFEEARKHIPGGVNSPVRAFGAVGGKPPFIKQGKGCRVWDEDGNEFIDYVLSFGPLILGHAHPQVIDALKSTLEEGTSFGAPTRRESTLARMICEAIPSMDMVRFVNSGTEAVMSAVRLARAFTHRDKIIKFAGGYHGSSDGLLAQAGSGAISLPDSQGVPLSYIQHTLVAPYNDLSYVESLLKSHPEEVAAIIVEPVAANMGVVLPQPDFLPGLKELAQRFGSLLIFDEVVTGFRLTYGSVQTLYGVSPDLICLGKIIGGGLPVGAYGGRREIMEMVTPLGPVYQAGTLSGNPLAMAAGIATLNLLQERGIYQKLEEMTSYLTRELGEEARKANAPVFLSRAGSMFTTFFTDQKVVDHETARSSDLRLYASYFHCLLEKGIYLPPSQFEAQFLSLAHGKDEIEITLRGARKAFRELR